MIGVLLLDLVGEWGGKKQGHRGTLGLEFREIETI